MTAAREIAATHRSFPPSALNPAGRGPRVLLWVSQTARPLKKVIAVRVTMKGGIRRRVTANPLRSPRAEPARSMAAIPAGTAAAPPPRGPAGVITQAPAMLASASAEVIERSMPPVIMTTVWPTARRKSGRVEPIRVSAFRGVKKSGVKGPTTAA